jgi:mannose-1-phosphate guanylyltransferase/mannose-6-phosphate isomerase
MDENIVNKPWGYYEDIHRSKELVFKRIVVNPQCRLSLQSHELRSEVWYVERGFAKIIIGNDIHKCGAGCSVNIPVGYIHRMENLSKDHELVIFEVQTGECDENDIVRLEDDYGREKSIK